MFAIRRELIPVIIIIIFFIPAISVLVNTQPDAQFFMHIFLILYMFRANKLQIT